MKNFFRMYKLYLLAFVAAICILPIFFYSTFGKEEPAILPPATPVEQADRFNVLVPGVYILNENDEDYGAVGALFSSVGYDIIEGSLEDYSKLEAGSHVLIVPEAEAVRLGIEDSGYIVEKIKAGQRAITWGKSPLSESLGITFQNDNEAIDGYTWINAADIPISFKDETNLELFSYTEGFQVLAEDKNKNPVMISGSLGEGAFILSGIPLISSSELSYEHFPFILEAVKEELDITPAFARNDLAFYVDIEYHLDESPTELANRIKSYGADQINLSAWYSPKEYGDIYREVIEACHKRGIAVYAWFELPYVSAEFWDKYPEWREKTASGEDAHIDWRRLMALSNPEALEEIKEYTKDFIRDFDWDGVDIAEIYFEAPGQGFEEEDKFTPMNDSFRKAFEERYGVDPIEAFEPLSSHYWKYDEEMKQNIVDFRVELITKLHEEFLLLCEELRQERPYLSTSVTVIDSIADKNMREHIGVDAEVIAKLQDKYHFMLQIEDPFTLWKLGPDRYRVIGEEYRSIMSDGNKLSIDINVIERGGEVYPTKKQRGVELYQLISNAGRYADKVILYALATFEKADMELVPYTAKDDIEVQEISENEYFIKAEKRFIWNTDTEGKTFYIDGQKWPFISKEGIIIPGGEHKLQIQDAVNNAKLFIESINGEISNVSQCESISFSYNSEGRLYMTLNEKPTRIKIDGNIFQTEAKENGSGYTLVLPQGEHKVNIY